MVKNTIGGKKGKMMANKNGGNDKRQKLRLIEVPGIEIFVCVTKVFGGGLFLVVDNIGHEYKAFLRGKMKGHNKRHNLVSLFSILLVALRVDTDPTKCDILFVYDSHDIQFLSLIPTLDITHILSIHSNQLFNTNSNTNTNTSNDILHFSNENANTSYSTNITNTTDSNTNPNSNSNSNTDTDTDFDFNLI